ncbi:LCP family protein [Streptomyces sp. NPDC087270]|uniref:LCP family protein n=1 Tax=Streptomyces sp. NPDC087270 TaxID=3365774 RepID=UPI003826473E
MRDGRAGGPGYGAASNPGGPEWDQGSYHEGYPQDLRQGRPPGDPSYAPYENDFAPAAEPPLHDGAIPGPRSAGYPTERGGGADGAGDGIGDGSGSGGPGGPGGPGDSGGPGGPGDSGSSGDGTGPAGQGGGHRRGGRRKAKSRKRKVIRWVAIVVAVAVLGSAGAAYGYYEYLASKIRKGERSSGKTTVAKSKANSAGQTPMNILILGSDTRDDPEDAKLGGAADAAGARADVIMIAHLSADRSNMSVVSIPRDTRVDIPECTDPKTHHVYAKKNAIINESLGRGGAGCTLATVQNLTGLYIDHWLTIDFAGVVKMADVVGGVEVCVKENVDDHPTTAQPGGSHLHLTKGTHTVKGNQALQWLRTRHAFGSDAGRSKAQHMYMSSLIRKLRSQDLFTDPAKLNKIATTAMSAFEVSSEIGTPKKLYDLGMQLKTIPPDRITMATMPHIADPEAPDAHYLPAPSAATVWSLLRNDVAMDANGKAKTGTASPKPSTSAPSGPAAEAAASIPVTVVNGTAGSADGVATPGRAGSIAQTLGTAGFTKAEASQNTAPRESTVLNYPSSGGAQSKSDALSVAKALKIPSNNVKASSDVQTITLTIGSDWKSGTDYSKTLPKAGSVPDDADVINGADTKGCMDILPTYQF